MWPCGMRSGWCRWLHTAPSLAGELAPGVVSAALSRRCPLAARPPERSGSETGRARSGTGRPFQNVPAQELAAGAACAISERSFVFFFICLSGRRVVARRQGTFLSHVLGHGTCGCLFWGPLSSGSQLCFHKPVVSWVVEVVRWGSPAFAVMGGPLGDPEIFFCVRVLGATGLSLTPLTPSPDLAGVRPAASH